MGNQGSDNTNMGEPARGSVVSGAPTASGSDCSILTADRLRTPYGSGTGRATTAGCPVIAARCGDSGT